MAGGLTPMSSCIFFLFCHGSLEHSVHSFLSGKKDRKKKEKDSGPEIFFFLMQKKLRTECLALRILWL